MVCSFHFFFFCCSFISFAPLDLLSFSKVNDQSACAVQWNSGVVVCWGLVTNLPYGDTTRLFTQISVGVQHICGVTTMNKVACFIPNSEVYNSYGEVFPPTLAAPFQSMISHSGTPCIIDFNDTMSCWDRYTLF